MFKKIKKFIHYLGNVMAEGALLRNAIRGWPNSQYELAEFYLIEKKDYVEAYAWADVCSFNGRVDALEIKKVAETRLDPDQIKNAWDKAREYRLSFINKKFL